MLVDDSDTRRNRLVGRPPGHIAAVDLHSAGIGLHQSAQDAHERRLACSVFADEGVNLARHHLERRTAVGPDGAEGLVDPGHPDCGKRGAGRGKRDAGSGYWSPRFPLPASLFRMTHRVLGTLMRPAIISCFSCSTRV